MTLNDKRYLICSVARKYANYKYEIDELINEAWLDENVRAQTEPKRLCIAAHWAMIHYMRRQEKRNRKYHIYTHPLIVGDNLVIEPEIIPFNEVDFVDEYMRLYDKLTPRQILIVKLRMEGFNLRAIGRAIGCSGERIRQILAKVRICYEKSNRVA